LGRLVVAKLRFRRDGAAIQNGMDPAIKEPSVYPRAVLRIDSRMTQAVA
jgi:hypothetical protein